jgi:hypothetical protein
VWPVALPPGGTMGHGPDPDPSLPPPPLEMVEATGPWGGPSHRYRGAEIRCLTGGHVCGLFMEGHPLDGRSFGVAGTITPLVDGWADHGRLPDHVRAVPQG